MKTFQQEKLLFELCSEGASDKEKAAIKYILENKIVVEHLLAILNDKD